MQKENGVGATFRGEAPTAGLDNRHLGVFFTFLSPPLLFLTHDDEGIVTRTMKPGLS